MAAVLASAVLATPLHAADGASLRIDPLVVRVVAGGDFEVQVVQEAPLAVSGAQASILFDPKVLQVESVQPGDAYANAPLLLPKDQAANIKAANESGRLAQIAAAFLPPGAVPAGEASFLVVRFRAIACGQSALQLPVGPLDAQMIDGRPQTYGYPVSVTAAGGQVITCVDPSDATPVQDDSAFAATQTTGAPIGLALAGAAVLLIALAGGIALWSHGRREAG
jgi:hypothetical protein